MFIGGDSLVNQEKNSTLNSIDEHRQQGKTTEVLKGFCQNRVHLLDGSKHSIYDDTQNGQHNTEDKDKTVYLTKVTSRIAF